MKKILFTLIASVFIISCENTLNDYSLPYDKKLVIDCVFHEGNIINHVFIGVTQPPLGDDNSVNIDTAELIAYIEHNGNKYHFKKHSPEQTFDELPRYFIDSGEYIPRAGDIVKLYIEWKGLIATAETEIPPTPEITGMYHEEAPGNDGYPEDYKSYDVYFKVKPAGEFVYFGKEVYYYIEDFEPKKWDQVEEDGNLEIYMGRTYPGDNRIFIVDVIDKQFYPYFLTYDFEGDFDIFSTSGNQVDWNIKGDGIGLFLGMNGISVDYEIK
jgi:hypothetical protein